MARCVKIVWASLPWRGVTRKCYRDSAAKSAALVGMLGLHRLLGSYRNKVTRYIALSEFSKQKFVEGGLSQAKVAVKPNFADISPPIEGPRSGALFVGRLSQEKGLHLLLEALRMSPNITCTVVGDGPQRKLVSTGEQIHFLGAREPERVYAQMRQAAYLVMPSICYEQFPRTLVEAFACRLPIIASRLGPLAELVEDGKTGLLFDPGSAEDLSNKLRFAEARPQIMREMGENARAEYELKYTPRQNYQQLMGIYAEAISTNKMQLSLSYGTG